MFHHRSSTAKPAGSAKRNQSKGRLEGKRASIKKVDVGALSKQDRLNALKQARQAKREDILERRRLGADDDGSDPPPKVVALIGFHTKADPLSLKRHILAACGMDVETASKFPPHVPAAAVLPPYAQGGAGGGRSRVILIDPIRDLIPIMDVAMCADIVLCVVGPEASLEEPSFDEFGYTTLTALKSQGLPVVLGAVHGRPEAMETSAKQKAAAQKFVHRYFASELGAETRLFHAGSDEEVKTLIRSLGIVTPKEITWRTDRGWLMAQESEYNLNEGTLCLKGYVRGPGLRCKHLAHLSGHGDFQLQKIAVLPDPCPARGGRRGADAGMTDASEKVIDQLDPNAPEDERPDNIRLRTYDPTMEEQTWPTEEELGEATANTRNRRRAAPAAIAAPQAAAGEPSASSRATSAGGSEPGDDEDDDMDEDGEGAESEAGYTPSISATEDGWDVSSNMTMEVPSSEAVAAERRRRAVLLERSQEELEFPDEVDTPLEIPAKQRFERFRGLKSFRTSPWDPYEELPTEYSRIWEFEAFQSTAKAVRQQYYDDCYDLEGGGVSTFYCAVYVKGVPPSVMESQPRGAPFVLSNLFPCEQKVSVVHSSIQRHKGYSEAIKSKQEVELRCGFRRLSVKPTYSETPNKGGRNKKFKFQRFLHEEQLTTASFYAPVILPPCRLLMFLKSEDTGRPQLAASGSVDGVDPKQLLIKRVTLTGYPFRVHKSKGVVRFMFFRPEDIRWFKPVELCTKKGLRGHITESLGTHGYMKCRFSGQIRQDDTVCMHLYKRVYPKWFPPAWGGRPDATPEDAEDA